MQIKQSLVNKNNTALSIKLFRTERSNRHTASDSGFQQIHVHPLGTAREQV